MIRIAMADDEVLFRQGLISILEKHDDIRVIFEAGDGYELLDWMQQQTELPDIVLLDLRMKPLNGIDTAKVLKSYYPQGKVIILTSLDQASYLGYMVKIGVNAFLSKRCDLDDLVKVVRKVNEAGMFFSEEDAFHLRESVRKKIKQPGLFDSPVHLTPREIEILVLICQEHSTAEIADKLYLSTRTVEGHRNNLLQKTGAKNVVGLVIYALLENLIDLEDKLMHLSLVR